MSDLQFVILHEKKAYHYILKKHLKVRKIFARWVPHLLTDEQKRIRVKVVKKLLQMFPTYDKRQFANVNRWRNMGPLFWACQKG